MTAETLASKVSELDQQVKEAILFAASCLKKRDLSQFEVQDLLVRRGFDMEAVGPCLTFLVAQRFIREEVVVEKELNLARGSRARGDSLIAEKLVARGIPMALIQSKLTDSERETESERALELLQVKLPRGGSRAKIGRFLWSRGFSEATIDSVLESYTGPLESVDLESMEV